MRKIVIVILLLIAVISSYFGIKKYLEYKDIHKEKDSTEEVEKRIKEVEVEIKNKQDELEQLKVDNKKVLEEIEVWQNKVKSIRNYL